MNNDNLFSSKIVILGESATGKSSIASRFVNDKFEDYSESTIGAAFLTKSIIINDTNVKFEIWDTAGQERYNSLAPMYYRGASAALVIFDITNISTYHRAIRWVDELKKNNISIIVLIANKCDILDHNFDSNEAISYANENNLIYYETSAKQNINIEKVFFHIGEILYKNWLETKSNENSIKNSINLNKQNTTKYNKCC